MLKQNKIVEKIREIPVTHGDISESIFGGINIQNGLLHSIHPYAGDMNSEDSYTLLNALYSIKQQILEASNSKKYKFNMGLPGILNFSHSNEKF